MPEDVDLLKVDVPCDATPDTPWEVTRLSHQAYFVPVTPKRASWDQPETVGYRRIEELSGSAADTDVYALRVKRVVSVTPLSLDMTSRVSLKDSISCYERVRAINRDDRIRRIKNSTGMAG